MTPEMMEQFQIIQQRQEVTLFFICLIILGIGILYFKKN